LGLLAKSPFADFSACRRTQTFQLSLITDFDIMSSYADILWVGGEMRIRTPADLGALIRDHRTKLGLDQKSLAQKVGVSRQWIVEVEKGKPRAEIGLLLRTVGALDIALDAGKEGSRRPKDRSLLHGADAHVDIDSIVASARRKRK
jgi:HTH-type transcriptional regulator / antitoxin HipB